MARVMEWLQCRGLKHRHFVVLLAIIGGVCIAQAGAWMLTADTLVERAIMALGLGTGIYLGMQAILYVHDIELERDLARTELALLKERQNVDRIRSNIEGMEAQLVNFDGLEEIRDELREHPDLLDDPAFQKRLDAAMPEWRLHV